MSVREDLRVEAHVVLEAQGIDNGCHAGWAADEHVRHACGALRRLFGGRSSELRDIVGEVRPPAHDGNPLVRGLVLERLAVDEDRDLEDVTKKVEERAANAVKDNELEKTIEKNLANMSKEDLLKLAEQAKLGKITVANIARR